MHISEKGNKANFIMGVIRTFLNIHTKVLSKFLKVQFTTPRVYQSDLVTLITKKNHTEMIANVQRATKFIPGLGEKS